MLLARLNEMKTVILCGGLGTRLSEEDTDQAQTDGRDWWPANTVAFTEHLQPHMG